MGEEREVDRYGEGIELEVWEGGKDGIEGVRDVFRFSICSRSAVSRRSNLTTGKIVSVALRPNRGLLRSREPDHRR